MSETSAPTMKMVKNVSKNVSKKSVKSVKSVKTKAKLKVPETEDEVILTEEKGIDPEAIAVDAGTIATVQETDDEIAFAAAEITHLKEKSAIVMVPALLEDIDRNFFRLGGVLSRISDMGWYMDKGHETFRSYVEAETDVGYRKAMYLIGIFTGLVNSGVTWAQVKHLGWTKLKELAPHLSKDNVDTWVKLVEGLTVLQIQDLIKKQTQGTDSTANPGEVSEEDTADLKKKVTMLFRLHADQKETIREALDKCKHESGTEHDNVALEMIALDYLGKESPIKSAPSLKSLMEKTSMDEVLKTLSEVFPEIELNDDDEATDASL